MCFVSLIKYRVYYKLTIFEVKKLHFFGNNLIVDNLSLLSEAIENYLYRRVVLSKKGWGLI